MTSHLMLNSYFAPLKDRLKKATCRFPLTIISCLLLFTLCVSDFLTHEPELALIFLTGFFWSITSVLTSENLAWSRRKGLLMGLAGYALISLWTFFHPQEGNIYAFIFPLTFSFASMFILPFLNPRTTDRDFWFFNYSFWLLLVSGFLLSIVFFLAGSAIFAILNLLTGWHPPYEDLWFFTSTLFGPLVVLSNLPRDLKDSNPESTTFFNLQCNAQTYIVIPVFLIYTVILYVYAGSIVTRWTLPNGGLASYVSGFGIVGLVTYFTTYALAGEKPLLKLYQENFFRLLLLPVALLLVAVFERISNYGLTEDRYLLVALAAFLILSTAIHYSKWRNFELRAISGLFLLIILFSMAGPQSASDLSLRSQSKKLDKLITEYHLVKDGKFVPAQKPLAYQDQESLSSILDYMIHSGKKDYLSKWADISGKASSSDIMAAMKLQYVWPGSGNNQTQEIPLGERFEWSAKNQKGNLKITGYDFMLTAPVNKSQKKPTQLTLDDGENKTDFLISYDNEKNVMLVTLPSVSTNPVSLDFDSVLKSKPGKETHLTVSGKTGNLKALYRLTGFWGNFDKDRKFHLDSMNGTLLIKAR